MGKMASRVNRIGVDVDSKNQFNLLKTYYNAKYLALGTTYIYETKNGYHIVIKPKKRIPREKILHVREMLGDDPDRLQHDISKIRLKLAHLSDTLFLMKKYENGKIHTINLIDNLFAKPFFSRAKPKKPSAKNNVLYDRFCMFNGKCVYQKLRKKHYICTNKHVTCNQKGAIAYFNHKKLNLWFENWIN